MFTALFRGVPHGRAPVVSLAVLDGTTLVEGRVTSETKLLVVARAPATNPTHPNVVSVPTQRIPVTLSHDLRERSVLAEESGAARYYLGPTRDTMTSSGHEPVVYAAESLLARKFELSAALESNALRFTARLALTMSGAASYDVLGAPAIEEPIEMVNLHVVVTAGRDLIPVTTASYSRIEWVKVSEFLAAARRRHLPTLGDRFEAKEFSIQGLCIASTQASLEYELARPG